MSITYRGHSRSDRGPERTKRPAWLDGDPAPQRAAEPAATAPPSPLPSPQTCWQHALNRLVGDVDFPADVIRTLRTGEPNWVSDEPAETPPAAEPSLDDEVLDVWPEPCATCASLELWQTITGDWQCLQCNPPNTSRRLLRTVERIRRQSERNTRAK
jgi:hypothetical protein